MFKRRGHGIGPDGAAGLLGILSMLIATTPLPARSQESICAQVKIQIEQQATLERQAFDAQMNIANGLDTAALESVGVNVTFQDESGATVKATSDPTDTSALFFIRVDRMSGIDKVDGNGRVAPATTAEIHWLIIPSAGAGGNTPAGKLYFVGATLTYKLSGEQQAITVAPDSIFVKPLPKLVLDYFLTKDVYADDPFTLAIEPPEPFTLGVRIKNNGIATARSVAIDSAQPKIVDNKQGLLVNFLITGGYVNDQVAGTSLLLEFGDIAPQAAAMGRWIMQSSLSGRFVDFQASFSHADDLGGAVTSILEQTNSHFLVRDVRVDLPGRDAVHDFLALDGDVLRVYESDSGDTPVTDQSAAAVLTASSVDGANVTYSLVAPATAGFLYVKLQDPFKGTKSVGRTVRSDGKIMAAENVWLSKGLNAAKQWEYFINFFDANSTGRYSVVLGAPSGSAQLPVLQFIPDRSASEGSPVGFTVQASNASGPPPKLSASPLPSGARFTDQGNGVGTFSWTPAIGQAGRYDIAYTAANGDLQSTQVAAITVQSVKHKAGPDSPTLISPALDAEVHGLRPILAVQGVNPLDVVVKYTFELYADVSLTQLVAQTDVAKNPDSTAWKVPQDLTDNTRYFWRARAFDGQTYSLWTNGRFLVNLANDAPPAPQPDLPPNGSEVDTTRPTLSARDLPDADGDAVSYRFELFPAGSSSQLLLSSPPVVGANGSAEWTVPAALNAGPYLWRAIASDPVGAVVESPLVRFTVNTNNHAPTTPAILQPAIGSSIAASPITLQVSATDPDGDPLTYFFELDTSNTFGSPALRTSGARSSGSWSVTGLADNTLYFWRARASDGRGHSAWINGSFVLHASEQAPGVPVLKNVGQGSWVDTHRPRFEVGPVTDPEGGALSYEFQLLGDAALTAVVGSAQLNAPEWLVPDALSNGSTYYWRARTRNSHGISSAWSAAAQFVVDTDHPATPTLAFSAPADVLLANGSARIAWQVRDPENASHLSLFFDRDNSGADGDPIVQNLALDPARSEGSYTWDVSSLSPGVYYVYGVLDNGQRTVATYAPGAIVVPSPDAHGTVALRPTSIQTTSEAGSQATLQVSLGSAPVADVVVQLNATRPSEANLSPSLLTFTPGNWNLPQTVTVTGLNDCGSDGDVTYRVVTAKALTSDMNYAGVKGADLTYVNADDDMPTNQTTLLTCSATLISSKRISLTTFDYSYRLDITNLGANVSGVQATVSSTASTTQVIDGSVSFGPIPQGARATSLDTFTIRQDRSQPFTPSMLKWTLTPAH